MRSPTELGGLAIAREQSRESKETIKIAIGDEHFEYQRGHLMDYENRAALRRAGEEQRKGWQP